MRAEHQALISGIVADCSARLGGALRPESLRPIARDIPGAAVADAAFAFYIDGTTRDRDGVLIVSNADFPDFAGTVAARAAEARDRLGAPLGRRVCAPLLSGARDGRTYALYERLDGHASARLLRKAQTLRTRGAVLGWLSDVFAATKTEVNDPARIEGGFIVPLGTLSADGDLDPRVREAAATLGRRVRDGGVRTLSCLQHGDLWFGNILFSRGPAPALSAFGGDFRVIDWGGCRLDGYPAVDALRYCVSISGAGPAAARMVMSHGQATGLTRTEIALHSLCAMGWLGANLDQFPKPRFDRLASDLVRFLDRHGFLEPR